MKKIALLALMIITNICNAQDNIGNYSFIEVPERFEFLSGDNPYQLSEMMVFYFEKYELKVYREKDSPNVSKCDILYADIVKEKSILFTKLSITIKDCLNTIIYKSPIGRSNVKLYSKAYPDALRDAFNGFDKDDINMLEADTALDEKPQIVKDDSITNSNPIGDELQERSLLNKQEVQLVNKINNVPQISFSNYSLNAKSYLLKKVSSGFILYLTQEGKDAFVKIGEIMVNQNATFSMEDIYGDTKNGYFNLNQDLIIKLSDGKEIVYKKEL